MYYKNRRPLIIMLLLYLVVFNIYYFLYFEKNHNCLFQLLIVILCDKPKVLKGFLTCCSSYKWKSLFRRLNHGDMYAYLTFTSDIKVWILLEVPSLRMQLWPVAHFFFILSSLLGWFAVPNQKWWQNEKSGQLARVVFVKK